MGRWEDDKRGFKGSQWPTATEAIRVPLRLPTQGLCTEPLLTGEGMTESPLCLGPIREH